MLSRHDVIHPLSGLWGVPQSPLSTSMNRLFRDFETAFARSAFAPPARRAAGPRAQLRDTGESIALLAELPGLRLDDIELSVEGETLTLKTMPRPTPVPEGFSALRRERQPAGVEWSVALPYAVDAAQASATLEQGRLYVTLPKAARAKPRAISVKAG
jgi:HSP20 family protein